MNEAEKRYERKESIIRNMYYTAVANGIKTTLDDMNRVAERLHRLETTLSRLAEDECNYPVYDSAKQERIEKLAERIIAERIGCKCYTQRDPRGYCIRMYLQDKEGHKWFNTWDGATTGLAW